MDCLSLSAMLSASGLKEMARFLMALSNPLGREVDLGGGAGVWLGGAGVWGAGAGVWFHLLG